MPHVLEQFALYLGRARNFVASGAALLCKVRKAQYAAAAPASHPLQQRHPLHGQHLRRRIPRTTTGRYPGIYPLRVAYLLSPSRLLLRLRLRSPLGGRF
jgi:hypothetical protein